MRIKKEKKKKRITTTQKTVSKTSRKYPKMLSYIVSDDSDFFLHLPFNLIPIIQIIHENVLKWGNPMLHFTITKFNINRAKN